MYGHSREGISETHIPHDAGWTETLVKGGLAQRIIDVIPVSVGKGLVNLFAQSLPGHRTHALQHDFNHRTGRALVPYVPPPRAEHSLPLVGIETNPGPKKARKSKQKKKAKALRRSRVPISTMRRTQIATVPSAMTLQMKPSVLFSSASFGTRSGLRLSGQQKIATVSVFSNTVSFTNASNVYTLALDPTVLGGPLQLLSKAFMRFRFKRATFIFRSVSPTSLGGNVCLGYVADGGASGITPSSSVIEGLDDSIVTAPWCNAEIPVRNLDEDTLFYNYNAGVASADNRLGIQGCLLGNGVVTATNGTAIGEIWLAYDIEMYDLGDEASLTYFCEIARSRSSIVSDTKNEAEEKYFLVKK